MEFNSPPRVFISYSQDSDPFCKEVLNFSNRLCSEGLETILDQYVDSPPEGWPTWMEHNVYQADYILDIASEEYYNKAMGKVAVGTGKGVKWESMLLRQMLHDDTVNKKIIPIVFNDSDKQFILMPLNGSTHYNINKEKEYAALYRYLFGIRKKSPPIGERRPLSDGAIYEEGGMLNIEKLPVKKSSHNYNMALLYEEQGNYDKADRFYKLAIKQEIEENGESSADCLSICANYAWLSLMMAKPDDTIEVINHMLSINMDNDKNELITAYAYNNLAAAYSQQGDYTKTPEWHKKALAIYEKVLGKEHPDTAATYNNIATEYSQQGDYTKALEWYKKALAIYEKVLGKKHPNTAATYNNIANVYCSQKNYDKALELYQKALEICEKVLGKEHPSTATIYNNIAGVYSDKGDYTEALDLYQKALKIREKVLGKEHPWTISVKNNVAVIRAKMQDYLA